MTGPTPSFRSPAARTISGISGSLFRGDKLKEAWPGGVLYGPPILRKIHQWAYRHSILSYCLSMPLGGILKAFDPGRDARLAAER